MRENASGFDFTSDWLRKWREKLFTQSHKTFGKSEARENASDQTAIFLSQSKYKQTAWSAGKREWFWFYIWLI